MTVSRPVLKAPVVSASLRLKQQYDERLSNFAFNFYLCRYNVVTKLSRDAIKQAIKSATSACARSETCGVVR